MSLNLLYIKLFIYLIYIYIFFHLSSYKLANRQGNLKGRKLEGMDTLIEPLLEELKYAQRMQKLSRHERLKLRLEIDEKLLNAELNEYGLHIWNDE